MTRRLIPIIAAGVALVVAMAWSFGMSWLDAAELSGTAAATSAAAALLGALALRILRGRTIGAQLTFAVLTPVVAVAAGSTAAALAMFFNAGDVRVLMVVLVASGVAGVVVSVELALRITSASRTLGEAVRHLGGDDLVTPNKGPSAREFDEVAAELAETSRRLREAQSRERELDHSRRELVAWISHDLRTPLAAIRAIGEALADGVVTDERTVERYVELLGTETERLSGLVDDLFELSRIQAGTLRLEMQRASLVDLVSDAVAAASVSARDKHVAVQASLVPLADAFDLCPRSVTRVLRNLLENAVRHTPSDGTVRVETGLDGETVFVAVADECGGIPETDLPRIFEPAFRGEPARTPRPSGGAGLGLTIAHGLVEAHHGDITVNNTDTGCRFVVRLPVDAPANTAGAL